MYQGAPQGVEIVSAHAVQSGCWLGLELAANGSKEIPAAHSLLQEAPPGTRIRPADWTGFHCPAVHEGLAGGCRTASAGAPASA